MHLVGAPRSVFLALLLLATAGVTAAQTATENPGPVQVVATAEPREVTIGDPIRYVVEVTSAAETEVRIPVLAGAVGAFAITDFGEVPLRRDGERTTIGRWYTLTIFDTGDFFIPAPAVDFRVPGEPLASVAGNEVLVGVKSLLGSEPEAKDIRAIKPPEEVPFDWTPYLILGAIVAAVLLAMSGLYWLLNRPRSVRAAPPRLAHEVALEALATLLRQGLIDAGEVQEFYVGLTRIIRVYLEDGFHIRAPEMTTEEFLALAGADSRLSAQQRRLLGEFLTQADLVKFARFVPTPRDCDAAAAAARRFVDETRPRQASSEEESHLAAA